MRAREPDAAGFVERDGVRVAYEVHGDGEPTILLLPAWSIVNSRVWKAQVPYLASHFRTITFDGRGCGRSSRPVGVAAYVPRELAADALAVLDATGTERAVLVGLSSGALWGAKLAAEHPDRILGLAVIASATPLVRGHPEQRIALRFEDRLEQSGGWAKLNRHYWNRDYEGFLEFFFGRAFGEPHSTKQIEDGVGWGSEVEPSTLADTLYGRESCSADEYRDWCAHIRCPVLAIHGDEDAIRPHAGSATIADLTGGTLVTIAGGGHAPNARDPVVVNLLIRDFVESLRVRAA